MKLKINKHDFIVGFSYISTLVLLVTFAACGSDSAKKNNPADDVISCDGVLESFKLASNDEALTLQKLNPGSYDYAGSEIYFEGELNASLIKIKSQEIVRRSPNSNQMEIGHKYSCREGYSRDSEQSMELSDVVPRLLIVSEDGTHLEVVERGFSLQVVDGYPHYGFTENEKSKFQTTTSEFSKKLRANWDQSYFAHLSYKKYAFVAKKKVQNGWIHVRVHYTKIKGDILADGDIFMPLPDVQL